MDIPYIFLYIPAYIPGILLIYFLYMFHIRISPWASLNLFRQQYKRNRGLGGIRWLCLLFGAELGGCGHSRIELAYSFSKLADVFSKLCNGGLKLIDLGMQGLNSLSTAQHSTTSPGKL